MTATTERGIREPGEAKQLPERERRLTLAVIVLAVALLGLGAWVILDVVNTSDAELAPFHAFPADAVLVTGTASCDFSNEGGIDPEGGAGFLVTCQLDMSDPRVSGVETHDRFRFLYGGEAGDVWVAEEAVITNAEGTWLGSAQAADDGTPIGEAHYVGEGGYDGYEFHYYFGHPDLAERAQLRGWISGGG